MAEFGLLGKSLAHSFSKKYFAEKFQREKLPFAYDLFELKTIEEFPALIRANKQFRGLNVTIPYKTQIIPFLDELDEDAAKIGAVNTIKFTNGKLKGFNTDVFGFEKSLSNFLSEKTGKNALIFGTGGASLAAKFVLEKHDFKVNFVSRSKGDLKYEELNEAIISSTFLLVNCTPVGTFPNVDDEPLPLLYELFSNRHFYFDMIYNPEKTRTASLLEKQNVHLKNGLEMLIFQAEKSWEIWNTFSR